MKDLVKKKLSLKNVYFYRFDLDLLIGQISR